MHEEGKQKRKQVCRRQTKKKRVHEKIWGKIQKKCWKYQYQNMFDKDKPRKNKYRKNWYQNVSNKETRPTKKGRIHTKFKKKIYYKMSLKNASKKISNTRKSTENMLEISVPKHV